MVYAKRKKELKHIISNQLSTYQWMCSRLEKKLGGISKRLFKRSNRKLINNINQLIEYKQSSTISKNVLCRRKSDKLIQIIKILSELNSKITVPSHNLINIINRFTMTLKEKMTE